MTAFLPRVACLRQQRRFASNIYGATSRPTRPATRSRAPPPRPVSRVLPPVIRTGSAATPSKAERKFKDGVPEYSLPRDKMRALVELYHEASDFITYDNLDERIDQAFTGPSTHVRERLIEDLEKDLRRRNEEPDYVRFYRTALSRNKDGSWSGGDASLPRLDRVRAALWGTTDTGRVGLEIAEEERDDFDRTEEAQDRLQAHTQNRSD